MKDIIDDLSEKEAKNLLKDVWIREDEGYGISIFKKNLGADEAGKIVRKAFEELERI